MLSIQKTSLDSGKKAEILIYVHLTAIVVSEMGCNPK